MRRNALYILLYLSGAYAFFLWPPITAAVTAVAEPLRRVLADDLDRVPLLVRCALALVVFDLLAYWVHRAAHANAFLWRFHRIHHSDPDLGPWITFRFHVVEIAWRMAVQFFPLYVLGVAAAIPRSVYLALVVFNLVAHSDLDWRFGPLVGPAYHGVHHRNERANFGMFFVAWDTLFGTRLRKESRSAVARGGRAVAATALVGRLAREDTRAVAPACQPPPPPHS